MCTSTDADASTEWVQLQDTDTAHLHTYIPTRTRTSTHFVWLHGSHRFDAATGEPTHDKEGVELDGKVRPWDVHAHTPCCSPGDDGVFFV